MKRQTLKILLLVAAIALGAGKGVYAAENASSKAVAENIAQQAVESPADNNTKVEEAQGKKAVAKEIKAEDESNKSDAEEAGNGLDELFNSAAPIKENSVTTNGFHDVNEKNHLYKVHAQKGKLTVHLNFSAVNPNENANISCCVLKRKSIDSVTVFANATLNIDNARNLSCVLEEGDYYIFVMENDKNFVDSEYTLNVKQTTKYDAYEADDTMSQTKTASSVPFYVEQTIDNEFDEDWTSFKLDEEKKLSIDFSYAGQEDYALQIYNDSEMINKSKLECMGTMSKNYIASGTFKPGTYFIRVFSRNGYNADKPYSVLVNFQ